MRVGVLALVTMVLPPAQPCSAQDIANGTLAVSTVTSLATQRQTVAALNPATAGAETSVASIGIGLETTYYITPKFGIGALVNYQRLTAESTGNGSFARLGGGFFGMLVAGRFRLDDRSAVLIVGSGGGIRSTTINRETGVAENVSLHLYGVYWLAGGGLSFTLTRKLSLEASVRYQHSRFSDPSGERSPSAAAGLLGGVGFSLYFR